jgi:hypothetical protein
MKNSERNWVPVRRGDTYCSPACGGRCTWTEYLKAKYKAEELVKELGPGWKERVHENLGWYWGAEDSTTCLNVSPSTHKGRVQGYSAYLNEAGQGPGGRWVGEGKTPKAAVADAIRQAKVELEGILAMVTLIECSDS